MINLGKDIGFSPKTDSSSAVPKIKLLETEQSKEFRLIDRITSIENSESLFTKSGHIGAKGRKSVDEIYIDLLNSTNNDFGHCLTDIRQTKLDLGKLATGEEINKRLNTILN